MKPALLSFIRFHSDRYEKSAIEEREYLQTILDLCVERIVDLDKGRDEGAITGTFRTADLASVLVEEEMGRTIPPSDSFAIDLSSDALEDLEDPICPRISCQPPSLPARLDANRTAKPLTQLVAHVTKSPSGRIYPDAVEDYELRPVNGPLQQFLDKTE